MHGLYKLKAWSHGHVQFDTRREIPDDGKPRLLYRGVWQHIGLLGNEAAYRSVRAGI